MARWRLGARLRQQDWVAFTIDLVIVVVGVFLGIQASNWNDERRDRRLAGDYLGRIADDLRSDADQLTKREIYWRASQEAGLRAIQFAEGRQVEGSGWRTLLDFYGAGQLWVYSPNDATYRELVGAGRLDLIRSAQLRRQLANYYVTMSAQDKVLFEALPPYRDHIRAFVPYELQTYILDHCQTGLSGSFRSVSCQPPEPKFDYDAIARANASNQQITGELRTWMTTLRYTRAVGSQNHKHAQALVTKIEQLQD